MPQLLFVHRWIGVVLAVVMLGWFFSGLVIANFGGSLAVPREWQLSHAESLKPEPHWLSLGEALARSPLVDPGAQKSETARKGAPGLADIRLLRRLGEPFWLLETDAGQRAALSAIDGRAKQFSVDEAQRLARDWFAVDGNVPSLAYIDTVDGAVGLRNLEGLKPFHRFAAGGGSGTILVVSAKTGDILQASSRRARLVNYVGDWLHLFRPLDAIGASDFRRDALTYAGFFAFVGAVTGVVIGWIKWKPGFFGRPTYALGRTQPYRETWFKYHFWAGLIGGVFALLWAGSGFLSTNPGQIFSPATPTVAEIARYRGEELPAVLREWRPQSALGPNVVELRWGRLGGETVLLAYDRDGSRAPVAIEGGRERFDTPALIAAAQRFAPSAPIAASEIVTQSDSYYTSGHGGGERPLPVLRIDFADPGKTSLYLDPLDGRLLLRIDNSRRAYRWLYSAVHHWDFGPFQRHLLARRIFISAWALFGLVLATSAVVLAWRRLKRSLPEHKLAPRKSSPDASAAQA